MYFFQNLLRGSKINTISIPKNYGITRLVADQLVPLNNNNVLLKTLNEKRFERKFIISKAITFRSEVFSNKKKKHQNKTNSLDILFS